ncbi:ogr/Delta-like zinc finger family protein [Sphingopyxis sp. J-6]|uniref:ogr/Delta-like zinc finger family protein n=1 Tax=Sphingopyxis sp. J-6 TaxID=3122054 RepID=UPI0039843A9E
MNAPVIRNRKKRNVVTGDDPNLTRRHSLIPCPHCGAPSYIRTSEMVTPTSKDLFYLCLNTDCGFTWKAQIAIVYGLSPSAIPNPQIDIPMAPDSITRKTYFPPPPGYDTRTIDMFDNEPPDQAAA